MKLQSIRHRLLLLGLCLGPAACSSINSEQAPPLDVAVPAAWQQGQLSAFNWGEQLNAPQLTQLIEQALQHNSDLQATALKWQASLQQVEAASGQRLPTVEASLNGRRQELGNGPINNFSTNLSVSWEADIWGRLADNEAAAFYDARQQAHLYRWARVSLASEVAMKWLSSIEAKAQLQLAKSREQSFKTSYEVIFSSFQNGVSPALDVYSAKAAWQNGQTNTHQAEQTLHNLLRQLAVLLGKYPDLAADIPNQLPASLAALPAQLQSDVLNSRPDLQAASDAISAQQARLGIASKNRLPRLTLSGSAGLNNGNFSDLLSGDDVVWSLLGGLTAPVFNGGELAAEQERQRLLYKAQVATYKQTALNALLEVESGLEGDALLNSQYQSAQQARVSADSALKQARESYASGLATITTLLQAERTAFDRRSQQLSLNNSYLQNRLTLYLALGSDLTSTNSLLQRTTELTRQQEAN